ncbi:conserved Plasmodium protein, unknown function [Plasmodium ovale wallikeri]|uniref:UBX domain-containing protein n=1 Tax=Plasmodium ovale wallikeri TaxID=864142 RepID=A0A1A8YVB8_PLAOA|nr:conserved Plasmodium protein, unknown function [Plasmodium ovale wallikeri]SBT35498.1 conserved Plasmodium protein, unknown function [Plasmodium ovale wallikeri]
MENNVKLFMEVTKSTNEKEAKDILEICQGNLEEAISTYLSKVDFEKMDEIPDSGSIPGVRRRIPEKGNCKENICERKEEKIEKTNFVLPNGIKIQNNFSLNHTIENIYDWAECCEYLEDNNITIPYKFELICGHTKSVLYNTKRKIKDFDLYPNAVLNMKSLDSSDEE